MSKLKGTHFKIDVRKTCLVCETKLAGRQRTFCSKKCRSYCHNSINYRRRGGADYQREQNYKKSIKNGKPKIQCKICGQWYRQVGSHVYLTHKITAREYREAHGFDVKKGQLPEDLKRLKAKRAIENETYLNLEKGQKFWFKSGQDGPGKYERSAETMERLRSLPKHPKRMNDKCRVCGKRLSGNQTKYCSSVCRRSEYKKIYNQYEVKVFNR